jgi:predicted ester cyclase
MSEQNRALAIRWFEEVWNQGKESTIDEMFHPEGHCYGFPEPESDLVGPEAFKAVHRQFKSAFSGIDIVIEDVIVEGDRVAIRWTSHMIHDGLGLGFPASGKKAALSGSSFIHIHNGQIMHGWNHMDFTKLALQLQTADA